MIHARNPLSEQLINTECLKWGKHLEDTGYQLVWDWSTLKYVFPQQISNLQHELLISWCFYHLVKSEWQHNSMSSHYQKCLITNPQPSTQMLELLSPVKLQHLYKSSLHCSVKNNNYIEKDQTNNNSSIPSKPWLSHRLSYPASGACPENWLGVLVLNRATLDQFLNVL